MRNYRTTVRRRSVKIANRIRVPKNIKPFAECSARTKRRRSLKIRSSTDNTQIELVYMDYLRDNDRKVDVKIIDQLRCASPERKQKIIDLLNEDKIIVPYTPDEALALLVDANLSVHQYELIQKQAKKRNANIYPSYPQVANAKGRCYPDKETISIVDTSVNIQLQSLLDHTAMR